MSEKMTKIQFAWDWNSRECLPEQSYNIETEIESWIGVQVMKKDDFTSAVNEILDKLFLEIEHGDKEHRDWLKNKIEEFKNTQFEYSQLL